MPIQTFIQFQEIEAQFPQTVVFNINLHINPIVWVINIYFNYLLRYTV